MLFYSFLLLNSMVYLGGHSLKQSFSVSLPFNLLVIMVLFLILASPLLLGGVPFMFSLGSSGLYIFVIAFSFWGFSIVGSSSLKGRYLSSSPMSVVGVSLFDQFVVLLRPITLTLRVLINVSLGHFLMMVIHFSFPAVLYLILMVEGFVYMVQSYVFITLVKAYSEVLN